MTTASAVRHPQAGQLSRYHIEGSTLSVQVLDRQTGDIIHTEPFDKDPAPAKTACLAYLNREFPDHADTEAYWADILSESDGQLRLF